MELVALYGFTGAAGTLLEVKRQDLPASAPAAQRFHWLWQPHGGPWQLLAFVAMQSTPRQQRQFQQGAFWFDAHTAQGALCGQPIHLRTGLPPDWQAEVAALLDAAATPPR